MSNIAALESLGQPTGDWDAWLITVVLRKVDQTTNHEWQLRRTDTNLPTYVELEDFVSRRWIAFESSETLDIDSREGKSRISASNSNTKKLYHRVARKNLLASTINEVRCG